MSYPIPTLDEAVANARARLRAELPGTDANLWPNTNHVYAKVWGGEVGELYQYLQWISRQRFATTADGDMLDEHGAQYAIARRAASPARGYVTVTGTPAHVITEGDEMERSDGVVYRVLITAVLDANGDGRLYVEANDTGPGGNALPGVVMSSTDADIDTIAVDDEGLGGGANTEDDESYRARILFRLRYPPHGGAAHDYVFWALSIAGVSRVWVDPLAYGPGTVGVWFMADDNGLPGGIPSPTLVGSVRSYIGANKPVTARAIVNAPVAAPIDVTISGLGLPSQPIQQAIEGELKDVFRRSVQVSMPNARFTLRPNVLWQAVARATADSVHTLTLPAGDVAFEPGVIPILGTICYMQG